MWILKNKGNRLECSFALFRLNLILICAVSALSASSPAEAPADAVLVHVPSILDGSEQPAMLFAGPQDRDAPLLVLLHWWSAHYDSFDLAGWPEEADARGWHLMVPDFRGPNFNSEACASPAARQDVLDAVAWMREHYKVDEHRIYLAGVSGGGHMSMVMATHAPDLWAGVSAWAGISDLSAWHAETKAAGREYWKNIEAVAGGPPGANAQVDDELRKRSPLFALREAEHVPPLDLNEGIHDGHTGSVPIHHTLDAFNAVAGKYGAPPVPQVLIDQLSLERVPGEGPEQDATYGRQLYLRRTAGPSRVTIFEGGHEGIPAAACAWLADQRKP